MIGTVKNKTFVPVPTINKKSGIDLGDVTNSQTTETIRLSNSLIWTLVTRQGRCVTVRSDVPENTLKLGVSTVCGVFAP